MLYKAIKKQLFTINPLTVFLSLWRNRELVWQLTKRDVVGRYRGSFFGLLWSFFNPILMLAVYTFVFGVVFKSRWGESGGSMAEFAIALFAGLTVYTIFSECINKAPHVILSNPNYVKKVVFPLEVLPWVNLGATLFHAAVSFAVLFVFYFAVHLTINWTFIFLPVVLLPLLVFTIGVSWFLASFGVYVRDVGQAVTILTMVLMFLSPIFYPLANIPESVRPFVIYLNPLTFIIEQTRDILIWGKMPNWSSLAIFYAGSVVVAWLGFVWFQITRRGFADVI